MAIAARAARTASSPCAIGAPNKAIMASPMCLSIVPPCCSTTGSTAPK
jgi:hypothetical protein